MKVLTVRVPESLGLQLELVARLEGMSVSEAVRLSIELLIAERSNSADFDDRARALSSELEHAAEARRIALEALLNRASQTQRTP